MKHALFILAAFVVFASCTKKYTTVTNTNVTKDTTINVIVQDSITWTYAQTDSNWSSSASESGGGIKYGILGNMVYITGVCMANAGAANTIFYLDSLKRPIYITYVVCVTDNGVILPALIYPNGQFYISNPPVGHTLHLDNIQYSVN